MYAHRQTSIAVRTTPDRLLNSATKTRTSSSLHSESSCQSSVIRTAARKFAGFFINCFTTVSNNFTESEDFKASSGSSKDRRLSSHGSYTSTDNSTHGREAPGGVEFTIEEILKATNNFSPSFKIGQGDFGTVYKGRLADGSVVAIKRAKKSVCDKHLLEFQTEIQTLAQVKHVHLIKFYGSLDHGDERVVVTEYVPNGTLREHLDCKYGRVLDLATRISIAIDVAHAITYIHMYTDHPIIHRDIKSSNILLTERFRAKVADFGFARLAADADSGDTHVSTQVKGTVGYLDPEYLVTHHLTEKSDVYSFGVLLVELITGRRPVEPKREHQDRLTSKWDPDVKDCYQNTVAVNWNCMRGLVKAIKKFRDGDPMSTLDPNLKPTAATNLAVEQIYETALLCLAARRQNRPSMRICSEILWRSVRITQSYYLQNHISFRLPNDFIWFLSY